ncbi:uncharacterized protein LOC133308393 [Gastrolobium bilobum]|uniref:uncharacterized protein LOC133308393 n=1 Tax=Gastrolobium bilobum TaxID=150636 RepID=UPI002AB176B9|nr:uncharacterized protein LOC133308393 [Gastrolobium bilobum]
MAMPTPTFLAAKFRRGLNKEIADLIAGVASRDFGTLVQQCRDIEDVCIVSKAKRAMIAEAKGTGSSTSWRERKFGGKGKGKQLVAREKYNKLVNEITNFTQQPGETLCAAWTIFQELIRKCPAYDLPEGKKVRIFYNGMTPDSRMVANGAAGGTIAKKTAAETLELIDFMARDDNTSITVQTRRGILQLGNNDVSLAEQKILSQQLASLNAKLDKLQFSTAQVDLVNYEYCQGEHDTNVCPTLVGTDALQVNGIWYEPRPQQNFQRNQNNAPERRIQGGGLDYKSNNYLQPLPVPQTQISELEKALIQFMNETRTHHKNQDASIRNLETQIGQLSRQLAERSPGTFPSDTIINPREHCNAITTKSKDLEKMEASTRKNEHTQEVKEEANEQPPTIQKKQWDFSRSEKPPYPMGSKQHKQRKQMSKCLKIFKKLQINIPFAEAWEKMPSYARFLKESLSKKWKLTEDEPVMLTEECSAILQKNMPPKVKDPGSFSIPCTIGKTTIEKVLCDLGARINVMPLTLMKKLGIDEVKPTRMTVQLVDRLTKQAHGIVKDALVKVNKFLIPVDFVILDIDEDASVPIIFGRPFLATSGALIDVPKGELIIRVDGEQATFKVLTNEAPVPASQPKDQVNYIAEKKVEKGNKKEVPQRHEESKPKVKMEKPKSKEEHMKPKLKVSEKPPPHPRAYDAGKTQCWIKKTGSSMLACFQPP